MFKTLQSKSLFYFLIVSLSGILFVSIAIQWGLQSNFKEYLTEERKKKTYIIESEILSEFERTGNFYNEQIMYMMHDQGMSNRLFYQIFDLNGKLIIDSTSVMGRAMMRRDMMGDRMMRHHRLDENMLNTTIPLTSNGKNIGEMKVIFPEGMVEEESAFMHSIRYYIYLAIAVTILLSVFFSLLFSRRLTDGFRTLSKAVNHLRHHDLSIRIPVENLSDEIKPLGQSFNNLAESLAQEKQIRKQFTDDLAHELRTPLATLRSQIEAYQDGIWEPTPPKLQKTHDELMRLVRLVNELEQLLAAENPQIQLNISTLEVDDILDAIDHQFSTSFQAKGVYLNIQKEPKKHLIQADYDRLMQILTNITDNALSYTPPGKSVNISITENERYISFSVKDEGVGISQEDLVHIFQRFYRGDKSRNRNTGGIGIGLSIVKALVDAHLGKIDIQSNKNVGTTVSVMFPKIKR